MIKAKIIMIDGEKYIHCPVCNRLVRLFDVCECNWKNTGETNIDGGPNKLTLKEAQAAYAKGQKIY